MSDRPFPLIQPVPLPKGTPEFEAKKEAIWKEFTASIPTSLWLPQPIVDKPPKDVSMIPRTSGLLTDAELDITEKYDAFGLAQEIAAGKLTSEAVVTAFCKRAAIATQLTCCLTEFFMDEAITRAKDLDAHLASTGVPLGPLHGVPISIKEHIPIASHWSSTGFISTRTKDAKDSQMVKILRDLGAVFYCKTNQPQSIMTLESASVWGRVLNPFNIHLSAGGSSGGEGALVALRGSVLGVGTDIGGSVRGPSGFCGIYGFKPTSYTLPMQDFIKGGSMAELNILCSTGPMGVSLRDVDWFTRLVLSRKPWLEDPRVIPIPWTGIQTRVSKKGEKLKVGMYWNDGQIQPQPPVTRALKWAAERLERSGRFEVKPFAPYRAAEAMKAIRLAYWPDGAKGVKAKLAATGEPIFKLTQATISDAEAPQELVASQVHAQRVQRDAFRCGFAKHWGEQDVDVVIGPVFVGPASMHDTAYYWNYTAFWNYVDYPGVVVPTPVKAGKRGEEGYGEEERKVLGEEDAQVRKWWEEGDFEGAPVDLQVVARRYHDNELLGSLEEMKDVLELWKF